MVKPPHNSTSLTGRHVHFIGIGGIGMSALARYFLASKWLVSGSDIVASNITRDLVKAGITVKIGHKTGNIPPSTSLVIYNRAISPHNPEVVEARRRGIHVASYAKALGDLTRAYPHGATKEDLRIGSGMYRTIAITGSHGKTTTTALVSLVLKGLDPTVLIGTNLKEFGGKNFRMGKSDYLIIEADDFGGAFLEYSPTIAIITNIDKEHLDFYKSFPNLKKSFLQFIARVQPGGTLIVNKDDRTLYLMRLRITSFARKNDVRVIWYSLRDPALKEIKRVMKIPGQHNVSNVLAAYTLGKVLGIQALKIFRAIGSYRGAWRRMEYRGTFRASGRILQVYDDYAHHPTEIKATLQAFREKYPHSPLICVFQPHQSERLRLLFKEFQNAFDGADMTLILPVYRVTGRDSNSSLKAKSSKLQAHYDSETLVRATQKRHPKQKIFYLAIPKNLKKALATLLQPLAPRPSPILIMMGAGNIVNITDSLVSSKK